MFDTPAAPVTVDVAVKQLSDAVDALLAVDLTGASRDELLHLARGLETQRRRLPTADHALIGELDARAVAGQLACASTPALLAQLLRLTPAEAKARARAAEDLGPRRALTGDVLPPAFPTVAAAQAEGAISERHAAVIRHTVHALPAAAEQAEQVEQALTSHALRLDPDQLGKAARRLLDCLDPDGTLPDERDHQRRRHATLTARRDGSGDLHVRLTPAALAKCQAVLDPLAAPHPAADGTPDPRTAGQRLHDAVEEAADRLLRAGELPDCGGTPATVLLTLTLSDLLNQTGTATTSHGGTLSIAETLRLAAEAELIPVVLNDTGGILAYGRTRRVATAQRQTRLGLHHNRRRTALDPPSLPRPRSATQTQHRPPHRATSARLTSVVAEFGSRSYGRIRRCKELKVLQAGPSSLCVTRRRGARTSSVRSTGSGSTTLAGLNRTGSAPGSTLAHSNRTGSSPGSTTFARSNQTGSLPSTTPGSTTSACSSRLAQWLRAANCRDSIHSNWGRRRSSQTQDRARVRRPGTDATRVPREAPTAASRT